ncbi:hypothetical protein K432DRAFT_17399 [Lepidopterella palustris CBS 459.81]|uniref:NACHT-NTPase and P-loop NTPases N-terminal domain-containing protein n=1 Tax=Lepidopterella palustris CBS 459.81 TaxID=1314670 RepID=A0A8E2ECE8_9PEZI|nr:hypothetical protein K432DRAFT_17399 [Lepidopterella palustris CBS 459.81]
MSLPISVGDVILLAQIAWGIGQAFTSGHRAAPAEFKEIQDLLFTLSEALKLLARDFPNNNEVAQVTRAEEEGLENESEADSALLAQMIMNCRSTLTHLKAMVDKYMELDKSSGQNEQKKWKNEVKKNWKMLLWTREGGDIIKLKTTLTAHINGLNLALAAINKRYGSEVKDHVEYMHTKLDDIYEWFKQYLEGRRAETAPRSPQHRSSTEEANDDRLYFAVAVHIMLGREDRKLICPRAAFRDEWLDEDDPFRIAPSIFQCCCSRSSASDGHTETLHVSLLPSSILVQVAIQGSESPCWHMYAASRNSPHRSSSVYISKVEPTKLQDLEAAAHRLSLVQARQHVMRNQSTSLVSFNTTMDSSASDGVVSVLASKTDHITHEEEGRCTISFRVGERQFSASVDVAYSVLHYKSMPESVVRTTSRETLTRRTEDFSRDGDHLASIIALEVHQPHAEVLFQGSRQGPSGDRGSTYYITCTWNVHAR